MVFSKRFCKFFLCFIISFWISNQSAFSNVDTVKLQLKWKHQFQFAGYYAAKIKKFYEDENLYVNFKEFEVKGKTVDTVVDSEGEYGISDSDIILDYANNKPVKVLASIFQHSPYVIISLKGKEITKPTDLSGKTVMVAKNLGSVILDALLLKEGIQPDSVKKVPYVYKPDFKKQGIDAITAYKSDKPEELILKGFDVSIIEPSNYGVDFYGDILFTSKLETEKNPERAERFLKASLKGWEYALNNPNEIIDYILTLPNVKQRGITRESLYQEFEIINNVVRPNLVEIGHMNKGRWERIFNYYIDLGLVKTSNKIDDLFFYPENRILKQVKHLIILSGVLLLMFMFFLIRSTLNKRKLKKEKERRYIADIKGKFNKESIKIILEYSGIILWNLNLKQNKFSIYGNGEQETNDLQNRIDSLEGFIDRLHEDFIYDFKEFLESRESSYKEEVLIKLNSVYQWKQLTVKAREFDEDKKATNYTGILLDISDIKKKKKHLEELSQELHKTNADLQKFAYITSHNLRAPVVNLGSLIDFYEFDKETSEFNKDIVNKMKFSVDLLQSTLNDLVEVVSMKSKNTVLENINLQEEVVKFIDILKAEEKNHIEIDLTKLFSTQIVYPRTSFNTVLNVLLQNAIKFKSPKRNLLIKITSFEIDDYVALSICDNGIGIDLEKNSEKIFGLYQRFNLDIPGRGIGLFLIKSQIESFDGYIEVTSKIDEGATFTVFFRKRVLR